MKKYNIKSVKQALGEMDDDLVNHLMVVAGTALNDVETQERVSSELGIECGNVSATGYLIAELQCLVCNGGAPRVSTTNLSELEKLRSEHFLG